MTTAGPESTDRPGRTFLQRVLDLRTTPSPEPIALTAQEDALAQGLAVAKVYAFVSIDYPGAAASWVFDGDGNDAVGGFGFDPLAPSTTPFGINDTGEIAGYYTDAGGNIDGYLFGRSLQHSRHSGRSAHLLDSHSERGTDYRCMHRCTERVSRPYR